MTLNVPFLQKSKFFVKVVDEIFGITFDYVAEEFAISIIPRINELVYKFVCTSSS